MSMIGHFIDMSPKLVALVDTSHEQPEEREKRFAVDIGGEPTLGPPFSCLARAPALSLRVLPRV
jgi:hypothetical protein